MNVLLPYGIEGVRQFEPGRPLGQAITAQALRPQTATSRAFTEWLTRLFAA